MIGFAVVIARQAKRLDAVPTKKPPEQGRPEAFCCINPKVIISV
jgi:hypothetical protein